MAKRSKSSHRWIARQRRDPYARLAAADGLGSRAHFKLEQLDRRFGLIGPSMRVLELGAAPGGWTRYLARRVSPAKGGRVVAVDVRVMDVPAGVRFIQQDIHDDSFVARLDAALGGGLQLVLSDMAPNISGVKAADQAASMALVNLATDAALRWLNPGGHLVVKMFQGGGVDDWVRERRAEFEKVLLAKPDASRSGSREVYGVALDFR
ncbi:MAG: RlmE family RNA methyltransferase [Gammaproteobacteria bacterium]|nr:MAG: RlmE family RNA methyltransferase [Gammaproteobacteria bacterium]